MSTIYNKRNILLVRIVAKAIGLFRTSATFHNKYTLKHPATDWNLAMPNYPRLAKNLIPSNVVGIQSTQES